VTIELASLVAHRGYAARYPENTRESLVAAVRAGARFLEFDVQLSADGVPVLLHDDTLQRTAGRPGSVFELSAAELSRIEVNETARLGPAFSGVRIPLLRDVVADLMAWPGVTAFVELKPQSLTRFGIGYTLDRVLQTLAPVLDACVVISFSAPAVEEARRRAGCEVGWAIEHWSEESRETATQLAPAYLFCNYRKFPPPPAQLWPGPWRWVAYEVTALDVANALVGRGVDLLETMAIAELSAAAAR
jgi:glycerophosphoryl diester phosphodiesterase